MTIIKCSCNSGTDVYTISDTEEYTHKYFPASPENNTINTTDEELSTLLQHNEALELRNEIVIGTENGEIEHYNKREIFQKAAGILCNGIDSLQQIEGFIKMPPDASEKIIEFLIDLLGNIEQKPSILRIPIIVSYNYNNLTHRVIEDIPTYITILADSELWENAVQEITKKISCSLENINIRLSYSYFIKQHSKQHSANI